MAALSLAQLRRFAVARTFFEPLSLDRAIDALGFIQADPIRAPARAQDLTLRHRVRGYRAGDLERLYPTLGLEEDTFINYGFVIRDVYALMHPRSSVGHRFRPSSGRARQVLDFVRERGVVHPREVERHFSHGRVTNYWGGSSSATTQLLEEMHYRGFLRVAGRLDGIRTYTAIETLAVAGDRFERQARIDRLVDVLVRKYAPLSARGLAIVVRRLRYAAPQWRDELGKAIARAKARLPRAQVDGIDWFWPVDESPGAHAAHSDVRFLTPFDPLVWDRERFARLWGWEYRFEAYTPKAKRLRGYYALPLLWKDSVIGWANLSVKGGKLEPELGFVSGRPPGGRLFKAALTQELDEMSEFLGL